MISGILMMLILIGPEQSNRWKQQIQTPATCWSSYLVRMERCRAEFPDATSIGRAVCEADAAGQYTACVNGIP